MTKPAADSSDASKKKSEHEILKKIDGLREACDEFLIMEGRDQAGYKDGVRFFTMSGVLQEIIWVLQHADCGLTGDAKREDRLEMLASRVKVLARRAHRLKGAPPAEGHRYKPKFLHGGTGKDEGDYVVDAPGSGGAPGSSSSQPRSSMAEGEALPEDENGPDPGAIMSGADDAEAEVDERLSSRKRPKRKSEPPLWDRILPELRYSVLHLSRKSAGASRARDCEQFTNETVRSYRHWEKLLSRGKLSPYIDVELMSSLDSSGERVQLRCSRAEVMQDQISCALVALGFRPTRHGTRRFTSGCSKIDMQRHRKKVLSRISRPNWDRRTPSRRSTFRGRMRI
ncbi:unnamed protein product [Amoebophrya sp. A25]|nr:unnamed protein product [Amoebophrya sp. A25]|eukprot:GSA25T00001169001.1